MRNQRLIVLATAGVLVASLGSAAALVSNRHTTPTAAATGSPPSTLTPSTASTTAQTGPAATSTTSPRHLATATTTRSTPTTSLQRISDPAKAADHLYDAWRDGDRQRARQFASSAAVEAMFAVPRSSGLRFSHCGFRLAGFDCVYVFTRRSESPDAVMRVEGGASAGWRVVSVFVLGQQRISDPARAADQLYSAWRDGDRQRAGQFADSAAVDAIFAVPRDLPLTFSGCGSRDLGFDCTYTGDKVIVIRVQGGASAGYRVTGVTVRTA